LGGCLPCDSPQRDETVPIPAMLDQTTMDDLARCHANAMDCDALCEQIYYSQHGQLPASFKACELVVDPATGAQSVHYIAFVHSCTGRRPANYRPSRPCGRSVGHYLARQAELEAASVRAFEDLLADLLAHR